MIQRGTQHATSSGRPTRPPLILAPGRTSAVKAPPVSKIINRRGVHLRPASKP